MHYNAFRGLLLKDIHNPPQKSNALNFKEWIKKGSYGISLTPEKTPIFTISDYPGFISIASVDAARLAAASIESIISIQENYSAKATAWPLIKSYYGAFFSCHALLRAFGWWCTNLDSDLINLINRYCNIHTGSKAVLNHGFYKLQLDQSNLTIEFKKLDNTHKDTWKEFYSLLSHIRTEILSSSMNLPTNIKIETAEEIDKIQSIISRRGTLGNWPSQIRNEVNYQQSLGAWFPYKGQTDDIERINNYREEIKKKSTIQLTNINSETDAFLKSCYKIMEMCYGIMSDIREISPNKSFAKNSLFSLINIHSFM